MNQLNELPAHRGVTHRVVDHTARRTINRCRGAMTLREINAHIERERQQATIGYSHFIDVRETQCCLGLNDLHRLHWLLSVLSVTDGIGPVTLVVSDHGAFKMLSQFAQWTVTSPKIEVWLLEDTATVSPEFAPAPQRSPTMPFAVVRT